MKVRLSRARALVVAVVAAGAAVALAVPAGAAVQVQSESPPVTARIAKNATLKAKGAGLVVTVNLTCRAGRFYAASVTVSQKVGGVTTGGGDYVEGRCTGSRQRVKADIVPTPKAFKAGTAFAVADIGVSGPSYVTVQTRREITLVK